jgi:hypothetical protein
MADFAKRGLRRMQKGGIAVDTAGCSTPTALVTHRAIHSNPWFDKIARRRKRFRLVGRDFHTRRDSRFAVSPRSIRSSFSPVVHLKVMPCENGLRRADGWYRRDFGNPLSIRSREFPK